MQSILSSGKRRAAIIAATLSLLVLGGCHYAHTDTYYYGGSPGYKRGGYGYGYGYGYGGHGYRDYHGHSRHHWRDRGHRW